MRARVGEETGGKPGGTGRARFQIADSRLQSEDDGKARGRFQLAECGFRSEGGGTQNTEHRTQNTEPVPTATAPGPPGEDNHRWTGED